jgi:hypothetical protein
MWMVSSVGGRCRYLVFCGLWDVDVESLPYSGWSTRRLWEESRPQDTRAAAVAFYRVESWKRWLFFLQREFFYRTIHFA